MNIILSGEIRRNQDSFISHCNYQVSIAVLCWCGRTHDEYFVRGNNTPHHVVFNGGGGGGIS